MKTSKKVWGIVGIMSSTFSQTLSKDNIAIYMSAVIQYMEYMVVACAKY